MEPAWCRVLCVAQTEGSHYIFSLWTQLIRLARPLWLQIRQNYSAILFHKLLHWSTLRCIKHVSLDGTGAVEQLLTLYEDTKNWVDLCRASKDEASLRHAIQTGIRNDERETILWKTNKLPIIQNNTNIVFIKSTDIPIFKPHSLELNNKMV